MFRISHVLGVHGEHDRRCVAQMQSMLAAAFPDIAEDGDYIAASSTRPRRGAIP